MKRSQLEHAIRAACQIMKHDEVIIVGSQAILGTFTENELPQAATMSTEIDVLPIADDKVLGPKTSNRNNGNSVRASVAISRCSNNAQHCGFTTTGYINSFKETLE